MSATIIPAKTVKIIVEDATLDLVCFEHANISLKDERKAGKLKGYVEATLAANPKLVDAGIILPFNTVVHLPEFTIIHTATTQRLWD